MGSGGNGGCGHLPGWPGMIWHAQYLQLHHFLAQFPHFVLNDQYFALI